MHIVEKRKINVVDRDLGLQIAGKSLCNLACDPVLTERSLNENIDRGNEEKQGQDKPFQYFFKSPQSQLFKVQN
jgi:hypothetical protein